MRLQTLMKAKRENLERLARWLGLKFNSDWSHRHLAKLVFWRCSRKDYDR